MQRSPAERLRWRTGALIGALIATGFFRVAPAQVPLQDQQPAGSALRPAVMGPSGGVSTGHPLTTAAAFGILLKGGNAFDAGVASLLAGGVLEQDLYSLGGEALVLVYPRRKPKSPRSSDRAGRRAPLTWTGTSLVRRISTGKDSILRWCPAHCMRP